MKKIFRRVPLGTARFDQRDTKYAVALERVLEHVAVAILENVKRQQRVRKKHRTRQRHHRHFFRQIYGPVLHFNFLP